MSESGKSAQKARLQRRLSSALRENLKRRKAQARGRAENKPSDDATLPGLERKEHAPDFRRNRSRE